MCQFHGGSTELSNIVLYMYMMQIYPGRQTGKSPLQTDRHTVHLFSTYMWISYCSEHKEHIGVEQKYGECTVSALSAGAYTTTFYVMVGIVQGGGRAPPILTSLG